MERTPTDTEVIRLLTVELDALRGRLADMAEALSAVTHECDRLRALVAPQVPVSV